MPLPAEADSHVSQESGPGQLGPGNPDGEKVGPDRYWKRPGFAARYCRNFIDALSRNDYFVRFHMQCQMAIAQGIVYLCEKPDRILDAGCGHGIRAYEIQSKYIPGSVVIGCDYSEHMISHANLIMQNLPVESRVRCEQASVYELPYQDATFDVVYSYGLLMCIENVEAAVSELMRVSRHGLVAIEETPAVMDAIQLRYWTTYKEKTFPGRTYWHDYIKAFAPYGTLAFNRIPTDIWEPLPESPEAHKVAPGYARFISGKS